ncbi:MAG: carboxypeptidase regulatory-like domain-containing protein [Acidobacteria bacterium]|nr:MAG: carboxypeptidase regulatory-like domain-containing protein [Acidobacteriota bacterium]
MLRGNAMKKALVIALTLLLVTLSAFATPFEKKGDNRRLLMGRVTDRQDGPIANAVVYLTNTRTRAVKTYIVGQDGVYRFPSLSPNIDYEVYAQFNGRKSDTKTVSQFDNRNQVNINLKVDTK